RPIPPRGSSHCCIEPSPHLYVWKSVDGIGDEERLTTSENFQTPGSWSPDGRWQWGLRIRHFVRRSTAIDGPAHFNRRETHPDRRRYQLAPGIERTHPAEIMLPENGSFPIASILLRYPMMQLVSLSFRYTLPTLRRHNIWPRNVSADAISSRRARSAS